MYRQLIAIFCTVQYVKEPGQAENVENEQIGMHDEDAEINETESPSLPIESQTQDDETSKEKPTCEEEKESDSQDDVVTKTTDVEESKEESKEEDASSNSVKQSPQKVSTA